MARTRTQEIRPEPIVFVISRNPAGRPALLHQLMDGSSANTVCGRDLREHSRAFLTPRQAAPILNLMCCKRCGKLAGRY